MEIKAEKFKIEMSNEELWSTAHDVKSSIINSLKSHWVYHQNSCWQDREKKTLERCKMMFQMLGRLDQYERIFDEANAIFKEFNTPKQTAQEAVKNEGDN